MNATELDAAIAARVLFYTRPDELQESQVDPLLWPAVQKINQSGWCWTAESCQGHPDLDEPVAPWGHNVRPMLRLVCRAAHLGWLLALLYQAMWDPRGHGAPAQQPPARKYGAAIGFEVWPQLRSTLLDHGWEEVLVYTDAHNVYTRNAGCKAFERFADLVLAQ